jgi:hypothetical protein
MKYLGILLRLCNKGSKFSRSERLDMANLRALQKVIFVATPQQPFEKKIFMVTKNQLSPIGIEDFCLVTQIFATVIIKDFKPGYAGVDAGSSPA